MDAQRHRRVAALLNLALALSPENRLRYLRQSCGDDLELLGEVERLMAREAWTSQSFFGPGAGRDRWAVEPGIELGRYRLAEKIGAGGMGEVFKASDPDLDREVALKLLPPEFAADRERLERFRREARALAAVSHPNIVTVYSIECSDDIHFITMEWVDGEPLDEALSRGPFPFDRWLNLARELAQGIASAHAKGIVHRDLKPSNVLIDKAGRPRILDFGLAKMEASVQSAEAETELLRTADGTVMGTAPYMSPEQARGEPVDVRSDLFSLGSLLYEAATGARPFEGTTLAVVFDGILHDRQRQPSTVCAGLPPTLDPILARALEKDPTQRYQGADELDADLSRLRRAAGEPASWRDSAIAVLPFGCLESAPEMAFLADCMADEIINALTKIESLEVLSRRSSGAFKDRDLSAAASELGVGLVLEGTLQQVGSRIRVSTRLVNADNGYHLWSERFDRGVEDVFAVQEEIAENVARALQVVLTTKEKRALQRMSTSNLEAYQVYVRANSLLRRFTVPRFKRAQSLFRRALDLDGAFVPAWLGLVEASSWIFQWGINAREEADLDLAREASERALEIAPERAESHAAVGIVASLSGDDSGAIEALERARAIDPRLWEASYFLARVRVTAGDHAQAVDDYLRAAEIRPDDYESLCLATSLIESLGRREQTREVVERAIEVVQRHVRIYPDDVRAAYLGGTQYTMLGDHETAARWLQHALDLEPNDSGVRYNVACAYVRMDRRDDALELLERSVAAGWGFRRWLEKDPDMDPLREHPRFRRLLERMEPS